MKEDVSVFAADVNQKNFAPFARFRKITEALTL
jgi:hypothetical protein